MPDTHYQNPITGCNAEQALDGFPVAHAVMRAIDGFVAGQAAAERDAIARDWIAELRNKEPPPPPPRTRKPRSPSIRDLVARAEKTGKTVTSVTLPGGATVHFSEPAPATGGEAPTGGSGEWDGVL